MITDNRSVLYLKGNLAVGYLIYYIVLISRNGSFRINIGFIEQTQTYGKFSVCLIEKLFSKLNTVSFL